MTRNRVDGKEMDELDWTRLILRTREGEFTDPVVAEVRKQVNKVVAGGIIKPEVQVRALPHDRLSRLAKRFCERGCKESACLIEELKRYGVVALGLRGVQYKDLLRSLLEKAAAQLPDAALEVVQVGVDVASLSEGADACVVCQSERPSQDLQLTKPNGIGAVNLRHVRGRDPCVVDVEQGWAFGHPCLQHLEKKPIHGENSREHAHGANVLSLLAASGSDCFGIAPGVEILLSSIVPASGDRDEMSAIVEALLVLEPGDILLLEIQQFTSADVYVPAEFLVPVWHLLRAATLCDIVVVEAAGNSGHNLDDAWQKIVSQGAWENSGAILVGATKNSLESDRYARWPCSNYADRVKVLAWGEGITVAGVGDGETDCFTATSAASAIVAGCAVVAQRRALEKLGRHLKVGELRGILESSGTPAGDAGSGRFPDLVAIGQGIAKLQP